MGRVDLGLSFLLLLLGVIDLGLVIGDLLLTRFALFAELAERRTVRELFWRNPVFSQSRIIGIDASSPDIGGELVDLADFADLDDDTDATEVLLLSPPSFRRPCARARAYSTPSSVSPYTLVQNSRFGNSRGSRSPVTLYLRLL